MFTNSSFSFSKKLRTYMLALCMLSMLTLSLGMTVHEFYRAKQDLSAHLHLKADLIGQHLATLPSQDLPSQLQSTLTHNPNIQAIWAFDGKQNLVFEQNPYQMVLQDEYAGKLKIVSHSQVTMGSTTVVMVAGLESIYFGTFHYFTIMLFMSFAVIFFAWLVSLRLQLSITNPLTKLLHMVERIHKDKDYTMRLPTNTNDDFAKLAHAVNDMLGEVINHEKALKESEARLNLALWGSDEVMLDWDLSSDNWFFDDSFEILLGYPREETPTCKVRYLDLVHTEDLLHVTESLTLHISGKSPFFEVEHRLKHKLGHWVWVLARAKVVNRTYRGKATRIVGTFVDITSRKSTEDKFKLFYKIFESTNEGVVVTDPNLEIVEINPAFSRITGFLRKEAIGKTLPNLSAANHEEYNKLLNVLETKGYWQGEIEEMRKNGDLYPQRLTMNKMVDDKEQTIHYVGVFSDITKDKATEDELAYLTHYDPLTGLANRTMFMLQLESCITTVEQSEEVGLAIIGLDNFKIINDSLGHTVGDTLLQNVAQRLNDKLDKGNILARITGDEFALILPSIKSGGIKQYCQRLLNALNASFVIDNHDIFLSASIGVSMYPSSSTNANELLLQADTAMYNAKQSGGNCVRMFTPEMNDKVQHRQRMETYLRSALSNDEFHVLYQPKVDAISGKIIGAEALVRWENPEIGSVSPVQFIGLAEDIGAIVPIGKWVLRTACAQTHAWHKMGFSFFKIAVNLSACQFKAHDFATEIARILWETNLEPEILDLELTESILMENTERCILMLKVLKSMGVTISIDDFGTGYSSLSYLRRFPIDALKIDRSFVQNVLNNEEDASIVRAIVAMAEGLNLITLAEGVETLEQVQFLTKEVGVQQFQGYYFSKPVTAEELTTLLQQQNAPGSNVVSIK